MFGYNEPENEVVATHEINPTKSGGRQVIARCRPRPHSNFRQPGALVQPPDYIRVEFYDKRGAYTSRFLLLFEGEDVREIDTAWAMTTADAVVKLEDVPYTELVKNDTGYPKRGGVVMY